ncbi:hypothetical protein [uncultured Kordia sp.]|uniref:hypothetical protein n=1 Tax=uncultured Kordia sp. TaxID=507699 RepID=UPI0026046163|nr:hypothetical protein [uncultured Kordia sp.]
MKYEFTIRDLYYQVLDYEGEELFTDLLKPWVENYNYKRFINSITDILNISNEKNCELYALSRLLDILTLHFLPNNNADGSDWLGVEISKNEYIEFIKIIGLETVKPKTYDTFHCEIAETKVGNKNFEITECLFPSVKLKNLLIKRSAVIITNRIEDYNLELMNNSKIYWTFRRNNRKFIDLSNGWGNNSQWKTEFRLDLENGNKIIYNYNGKFDLNQLSEETLNELKEEGLEVNEAIELIVNRHFIKCSKDDSDLFPYNFRYDEIKKDYA